MRNYLVPIFAVTALALAGCNKAKSPEDVSKDVAKAEQKANNEALATCESQTGDAQKACKDQAEADYKTARACSRFGGGPYCTDTTRSSRDRGVDGEAVTYAAIFARPCRSNGSRKRSSTTPNTGIAKLKGSKAKNPNARVAGNSQVGRFGWHIAAHRSRRSLPANRQSLKILRMSPPIVFCRVLDRDR
jgi:hypothetical protein